MILDWGGRLARLAEQALRRAVTRSELAQLRTATTLESIRPDGADLPAFTFTDARLTDIAYLARLAELQRSSGDRRQSPGALPTIAAAFEDLAHRSPMGSARRLELLAEAASMWSVAGYQANSVVVANSLTTELAATDDQSAPTRLVARQS